MNYVIFSVLDRVVVECLLNGCHSNFFRAVYMISAPDKTSKISKFFDISHNVTKEK